MFSRATTRQRKAFTHSLRIARRRTTGWPVQPTVSRPTMNTCITMDMVIIPLPCYLFTLRLISSMQLSGNYTPEPALGRVSRENTRPSDDYDYAPYSSGPTYSETRPNDYDGYRSPPMSPPYIPPSNYRPASVSSRSTPREEYTPYDQVVPSTSGEHQQPYQPRYESPRRQRGNVSRQRSRTLVDSDEFDVEMEDYSSPASAAAARNDRRSNHVASPARSGSGNRR